jgi:hypothetical protein
MDDHDLFINAQRYITLPYLPGQFDCADLAALVQRELFRRDVTLPAHGARPHRVEPVGSNARANRQGSRLPDVAALRDQLAERAGFAKTGCAVLLWAPSMAPAGEPERLVKRWHIGTVFMRPQRSYEPWVLHSDHVRGTQFQPLADLLQQGLRLEGFYEWRAA